MRGRQPLGQELQSLAEQVAQPLLATDDTSPSPLFAKAENIEITRSASGWPAGQVAGSLARTIGRSSSNLWSQTGQ
jgi:hypothetical protein